MDYFLLSLARAGLIGLRFKVLGPSVFCYVIFELRLKTSESFSFSTVMGPPTSAPNPFQMLTGESKGLQLGSTFPSGSTYPLINL